MSAAFLQQIDWTRPWLAQVRECGEVIAHADDWRAALNRCVEALGVRNHRGLPIRFVPQSALQPGVAYEQFISDTGGVPTRDNLHDFFNALVWLHFPRIKVQLNAIQAAEIERCASIASAEEARAQAHGQVRGKVRDAATIFDENAVLFVASDPSLVQALRMHDWHTLFIARRAALQSQSRVLLFGHALMEKLVQPYKAITGHTWIVAPCVENGVAASLEEIDAAVAQQLAGGLSTADFSPLPVLGVPDWWHDQDETFYADASVFRPPRQR
ncbi:hypothetical protein GCM10007205_24740 [Oxalicibacterium flavum]|uniref:DUF3025 domain-containing protein n=1 Tax=Oxalicibacterium flavum TaxID=179467 RepID=A0A8J2UPD1_9BURK|nr:DUF3025 domain-containing protein [Oxalicibacterium flavum]GGC14867.1 hypothetical protein GCM10007205_24740 [Oxalicibacterium flavum]